ncbi:ATP-binding cassette sub-family G member 1-like isoform X2 [Limulus polyphemus]|uniref:ATP-binding cassette sub-family G member 1-like isoform X2 n=1 Tax=Limulus polyphemus TaxID=6850 RepID=A0ABM1S1S6_LIMPO|nr:ATP-binding cassette sub-family G member 1-like isoform X2 [Limulus polyphemus]
MLNGKISPTQFQKVTFLSTVGNPSEWIAFRCEHKIILNGISGEVVSGEMTAVMGPSGAGKSTLMNILTGYITKHVEGETLVNNTQRELSSFRRLSSYVMQDDFLLPQLTVKETLTVAANLKIPSGVPVNYKQLVVSEIIDALGLKDCANTKTCQISGGQRKRLSIGQELVNNPSIIFLDEPTSGLDSSNCDQCITLLKTLAKRGCTVVCSIHQPSARIYEKFDKLYMLAEGQCIYQGPVNSLVTFLSCQGLDCPTYHNPADFITEIASGEYGDQVGKLVRVFNTHRINCKDSTKQHCTTIPQLKPNEDERAQCNSSLLNNIKVDLTDILVKKGYPTSLFNQFLVLVKRTFLCVMREPMLTQLRLATHLVVGVMIGLLFLSIGNDAGKMLNNSAFLFFTLLFLMFTSMMPTVLTFPLETSVFIREHLNCWYSTKMYYLAKTVADMPFQIIFSLLYSSIVYWMTSQPFDSLRFLIFLVISVLTSLVSQAFGLILGAACDSQTAVFLAPASCIPFLLFSGFFITFKTIPGYLQWLSYISYMRYAFEGLMLSIYGFDRPDLECRDTFCPFVDPSNFLEYMDMNKVNLYFNIIILCIFFLAFRLVAYLALRLKLTFHK